MFKTIGGAESKVDDEFFENSDDESLYDDLIAYYNMNDNKDDPQINNVGGEDLQVSGDLDSGDGVENSAIYCPGIEDGVDSADGFLFVDNDDAGEFDMGEDDFSISFWFKPHDVNENEVILSKGGDESQFGFLVYVNADGISMDLMFSDDDYAVIQTSLVLEDDEWNFIVITVDRSGKVIFHHYTNNNYSKETRDISEFEGEALENTNRGFTVCSAHGGDSGVEGYIDMVGIWRRKLTDGEIDDLYNNSTGLEAPF